MAKPFIKWAGGKSKLAPIIESRIEKSIGFKNVKHYIEAFTGGGALFFHMVEKYEFDSIVLIDINVELINAYKAIQDNPQLLIKLLEKMQVEYNTLKSEEEQSIYYYDARIEFNLLDDKSALKDKIDFERAALFIFLNKTCFNGLYRENSKGKYNVPFGKRKSVNLFDRDNILKINEILQNVTLLNGDYTLAMNFLNPDTLVYLDPPYRPITGTAAFTAYSKQGFNDDNQIELARFCREVDKQGAYFVLSNSDPYNAREDGVMLDDFFDNLYSGFEIHRVHASRAIAANGKNRKSVTEILVLNEQIPDIVNNINTRSDTNMLNYADFKSISKDEQFSLIIDTLSPTNRTPEYYVNWNKVEENTKPLEISLHTLDYLIGKKNIYECAKKLFNEQPKLLKAVPSLLAIRDKEFEVLNIDDKANLSFNKLNFINIDTTNINSYLDFLEKSGLLNFLANKATKSLVDYVFGVETGLDSNARKNRSGTFMENIVEEKIKAICEESNLQYIPQANAIKIKAEWNVEVPYKESMRNHDFAVYNPTTRKLTIIEVNYYGGGGSKLKSVAGEFTDLCAYFTSEAPHIQFAWITDGQGWHTAKKPLRDSFEDIHNIINLNMMNEGYLKSILTI